jgi:triphosphoribosyl-dephospho-CoA synthase
MTPDHIAAAFLRACALDVAVRKPGNVSTASPGHRMVAQQFLRSAEVTAPALCAPGAPVGQRIEAAMRATWDAVGCNTNLGIVLLCAPLAGAAERWDGATAASLHQALGAVLDRLDRDDAAAAFRAIALVQPGGLGRADAQDVHTPPTVTLREAMALAAGRDRIALQYAHGFDELFALGLPAFEQGIDARAVQLCFLQWLRSAPDTHVARKHGAAAAQSVQAMAQRWWDRLLHAEPPMPGPEADATSATAWAEWDESLKQRGLNPGTSADLTVASAFLAALLVG